MHSRAGEFLKLCQTRYKDNPVLFAKEVIGITLTENQQQPALDALANGKRRVAIKSGHGTGKSCLSAVAILWFLCTRPMCNVIVTAPSANQLYKTMMKEIRDWYNKSILKELDLFRFTRDTIKINDEDYCNIWFLSAVSVANPENISGTHATSVLAVVDEGAGVDTEIFVRLEGVLTTKDTYMLTCGNPSFTSGYFYDIFHNEDFSKKYDLFTFSCTTSKNVDEKWLQDMEEKYGADSAVYKVRVLGEFAPMNEEVIIRREDVHRAIGRKIIDNPYDGRTFIGVDVSSGNSNDFSCISVRQGYEEIERIKTKCKLRDLFEKIKYLVGKYKCCSEEVVINADTTGLGIQLGQDLDDEYYYDEKVTVNQINFSWKAINKKQYANAFTEMFFTFGDIIEKVSLLKQDESNAEEDLGSRRYEYDRQNRYSAERKKELIKRLRRSPDEGDAILLAFYDIEDANLLTEKYIDKEEW